MKYIDMVMAAQSDDPIVYACGRVQFLYRLSTKNVEEKLLSIERDHLATLYGFDRVKAQDIWLGYKPCNPLEDWHRESDSRSEGPKRGRGRPRGPGRPRRASVRDHSGSADSSD